MIKRSKTVFGECRLCKRQDELVEGHIIPRFFLRQTGLTGSGRKFHVQCFSDPSASEPHRQDGFKQHMMCRACDNHRIGKLEDYAARQFLRQDSPLNQIPNDGYLWTGLDYHRMKLFLISLLWRMHHSEHGWFYYLDVGPAHEERMRQMLLGEAPRETWRYGWRIGNLLFGPKPLGSVFSQPQRVTVENTACYRFVLGGIVCFVSVSSRRLSPNLTEPCLQLNGTWPVPTVQALSIGFVKEEIDLFREHGEAV